MTNKVICSQYIELLWCYIDSDLKLLPMKHILLHLSYRCVLSVVALFMFSALSVFASNNEDVLTDIILINGEAVLVDLDNKGEVLKKHIDIPEYFRSSRSHESLRRSSLIKAKSLSENHKIFDLNHFLSVESEICNMERGVDDLEISFNLDTQLSKDFVLVQTSESPNLIGVLQKSYAIRRVKYLS